MNHVKAWHRLADGYDATTVRIDAGGEPVEEREPTSIREASILVRARELWEQGGQRNRLDDYRLTQRHLIR
ncbi:hypothetical protein C7405_102507 [Paraburkholderia caballeronis]|uniref:hypothetical protein n=1 Tax=Paraburkholderia caballeronis TaxID=416943 RepID=UPI001065DDDB|nr:hypothetical protein [Paraburkholderia caballeronis]TDV38299.1 hypothetical protein C7405_102507 [Paraburkholderia caballeronis]